MPTTADIDTLLVEGWRFGQYGPGLDPAVFAAYSGGSPYSDIAPGWSEQEIFAGLANTTPVLDEVVVTAEPTKAFVPPPVPPSLLAPAVETIATIGSGLAAGLAGLVGLLMPSPTAPRELDEAPDPMPTVDVVGTKPPPRSPGAPLGDAPLPPNWNDLVNWTGPITNPSPFTTFAFPGDSLREFLEREPLPSQRRNPAPARPPRSDPVATQLPELTITARRPRPAPISPPAPYIFGDAFELPFGIPFGDPFIEPIAEPQPDRIRKPVRNPRVIDAPSLFAVPTVDSVPFFTPWADPFSPTAPEPAPDVPTGNPLPAPPGVASPFLPPGALPPGFIDPIAPGLDLDPLTSDRIPLRPTGADTCNCAKPQKRKPRKPRTICRKGTYIESADGLKKQPRALVSCDTGEEFGSDRM